ncbi:phage tail tape measure protein, partial [Pseudocitrobacter sp. 73]
GLVNWIKNKWGALTNTVSGMRGRVGGWFKEKLGIRAPRRVFMGFGWNIYRGAAIGLQRTTPLAALAGQRLAEEMMPEVPRLPPPEIMRAGYSGQGTGIAARGTRGGASNGGINVINHIYIDGKNKAPAPDVANALKLSIPELERALEAVLARKRRVAYD